MRTAFVRLCKCRVCSLDVSSLKKSLPGCLSRLLLVAIENDDSLPSHCVQELLGNTQNSLVHRKQAPEAPWGGSGKLAKVTGATYASHLDITKRRWGILWQGAHDGYSDALTQGLPHLSHLMKEWGANRYKQRCKQQGQGLIDATST